MTGAPQDSGVGTSSYGCRTLLHKLSLWRRWGMPALILALPFLLFHWMLPFVSRHIIGNDYTLFGPQQQLALAFSVKMGSHPLYVPGFAGGQAAAALTLGQLYHPIFFIARHLPGYWDGYALEWNTFLRLVSLGAAHLLLYAFLRRLSLTALFACGLSMITTYNLRMLDMFRYGPALETWTAFLALCSAVGLMHAEPGKVRWRLLAAGATYCLITSGHPQMAYYGMCGAVLFSILVPGFLNHTEKQRKGFAHPTATLRAHVTAGCSAAIGVLLALPYLLPFYVEFVLENANRVGQSYAWAAMRESSLSDLLRNFCLPLRAQVESAFGVSPLYAVALFAPPTICFRRRVGGSVWGTWVAAIVVLALMTGDRTPLHYLFWRFMPFASAFRIPGRVSMLLPPLFMLLLGWFLQERHRMAAGRRLILFPLIPVLALHIGHIFLFDTWGLRHTTPTAHSIRDIPWCVDYALWILAVVTVVVFAVWTCRTTEARRLELGVLVLSLIQVYLLLRFGTWVETKERTETFTEMAVRHTSSLDYRHVPGEGLYSRVVWNHLLSGFPMEPFLAVVYPRCLGVSSDREAYERLRLGRRPCEAVVLDAIPDACLAAAECGWTRSVSVELTYASYNRLRFAVDSPSAGVFVLGFPWSSRWVATVDGAPAAVKRTNGAAMAVHVPKGSLHLEFRYRSRATEVGMALACAVLTIAVALCPSWLCPGRFRRWLSLLGILPVLWFAHWRASLYGGNNMGTSYRWQSGIANEATNVAFWKPSRMSSILSPHYPHFPRSSRAVDGDTSHGSGSITAMQRCPWWAVDFGEHCILDSLVVHERLFPVGEFNERPLVVEASMDCLNWTTIGSWTTPADAGRLKLVFRGGKDARFIRVRAAGVCKLALDEVRAFGRKVQ